MPSRRSDRGEALAKAIRSDPEFYTAKLMAEFSEPYGTASAIQRVLSGEGEALDYLAAVPVLGIPARWAKKGKGFTKAALESSIKEAKAFKGKTVLTEMDIDDFLKLAEHGIDEAKKAGVKGVKEFDDVPYLKFDLDGDIAKVKGHEGRHRAMELRDRGESVMPVRMKGGELRFDQQNPKDWDFQETWPSKIVSETDDYIGDFPIRQGQSGVIEEPIKMGLKSNTTDTADILRMLMGEYE